jgi:hypothetical protein
VEPQKLSGLHRELAVCKTYKRGFRNPDVTRMHMTEAGSLSTPSS